MRCCKSKRAEGGAKRRGCRIVLIGMLMGVVLGILIAPKPGAEIVGKLRELALRKLPV